MQTKILNLRPKRDGVEEEKVIHRVLTAAAGYVHVSPGAVGKALTDLWANHLSLSPAHILNLIVHWQEVDSLHLVTSQAPVPNAPFPWRMYNLAT